MRAQPRTTHSPRKTTVRIRDLAEEVRETKRRKLRSSSFAILERALDSVLLPEVGDLEPVDMGPDRIAQLIRDLEDRGYRPATVRRYLHPLRPIVRLAMRRGLISTSPLDLLSEDERPTGGGVRDHYVWTAQEISHLIAAADELGRRREAQYNYAPLIQLLALTGLRVGEALALQWANVDLAAGELYMRASLSRNGELLPPKTRAGARTVPLSQALVDVLASIKPSEANGHDFVFSSGRAGRPIAYRNVRTRVRDRARACRPRRARHHHPRPAKRRREPPRPPWAHPRRGRGCTRPRRCQHHAEGVRAPVRQVRHGRAHPECTIRHPGLPHRDNCGTGAFRSPRARHGSKRFQETSGCFMTA